MGITCRNGHNLTAETIHLTKRGRICRVCEYSRKKKWADKTHYWDWYRFDKKKAEVLARDNHKCVNCLSDKRLSVDHIDRDRSNNELSNLQTLCLPCHGAKDGVAGKGIKKGEGKYA